MLQAGMTCVRIRLCSFLDPQHRLDMLQHEKLMAVAADLGADFLSIKGCRELVAQVTCILYKLLLCSLRHHLSHTHCASLSN